MEINTRPSIFSEVADFIVSQPSLEAIADFRASDALQQRLDELLDKNGEEGLTADEQHEVDQMLTISHLMTMMKAKARRKLKFQGLLI